MQQRRLHEHTQDVVVGRAVIKVLAAVAVLPVTMVVLSAKALAVGTEDQVVTSGWHYVKFKVDFLYPGENSKRPC